MSTNTATSWPPAWLAGITRKRPETAQIVYAMLTYAYQNGFVTAEDVKHVPATHPNVWGAAAKYLRAAGLEKGEIIEATRAKAKGHLLRRWILRDPQAIVNVRRILNHLANDLCRIKPDDKGQLTLL